MNLRTIIPLVGTNRICFKTIFVDLCFDSFGMNGTVVDVSGRDKNIGDQAVLIITNLVTQIMETVGLTGTVHITAFRIGLALFDLLGFRLYMICVICLKQTVRDCLFIQSFDIGARLVCDSNSFVQIVSCVSSDMGRIGEKKFAGNKSLLDAEANNLLKNVLKQCCAVEFTAAKLRKVE